MACQCKVTKLRFHEKGHKKDPETALITTKIIVINKDTLIRITHPQ